MVWEEGVNPPVKTMEARVLRPAPAAIQPLDVAHRRALLHQRLAQVLARRLQAEEVRMRMPVKVGPERPVKRSFRALHPRVVHRRLRTECPLQNSRCQRAVENRRCWIHLESQTANYRWACLKGRMAEPRPLGGVQSLRNRTTLRLHRQGLELRWATTHPRCPRGTGPCGVDFRRPGTRSPQVTERRRFDIQTSVCLVPSLCRKDFNSTQD